MSRSAATNVSTSVALRTNSAPAAKAQPAKALPAPAASSARTASAAPLHLGSWRLESLLGQSAMARVYRAHYADAADNSRGQYAIKVLRKRWHDHPAAIARLRREATIGRCIAHRHVISVFTAHVHQSPYYVVMPCVEGQTVAALAAPNNKIKVAYALWIARQAAEALDGLHSSGYLHGDIKPGNIFVSSTGHVTLIDLGCARRFDHDPLLDDSTIAGTPAYLAPEVLAATAPDVRSDLYSLGITLYEMLAGRLPWDFGSTAELVARKRSGPPPSVRMFAPHVPSEVAQLVSGLTAVHPVRRPPSARDVVRSLVKLEVATLAQHVMG